jgi:hypothetical protein
MISKSRATWTLCGAWLNLASSKDDVFGEAVDVHEGATANRVAALTQPLSASEATRIEAQAYQRATSEILQVVAGSPGNVAPVFEAIVQSSAKLCEAEFSAITLFDGKFLQLVAVSSMSAKIERAGGGIGGVK